jgi:predicted RNA-binding Zn ribbon-like protein
VETLREPDDLVGWLREALLLAPGTTEPATAAVLMSARRLRESVDRAVLAVADGRLPTSGDLTLLNGSAAAAPRPALQLVITGDRLEPADPSPLAADPALALALIAQDAVDLLLSGGIRRVRVCEADNCALRFLDRSPARNRRWCSMSRCGNRAKVRLHQARARQSGPTTET